jgi:hypothetical protein
VPLTGWRPLRTRTLITRCIYGFDDSTACAIDGGVYLENLTTHASAVQYLPRQLAPFDGGVYLENLTTHASAVQYLRPGLPTSNLHYEEPVRKFSLILYTHYD